MDSAERKEAKKTKKPTRERNNKRRAEEKIHRERQHTFNTISTTDTKKNVYEKKIRAASHVVIILL